jgi:eukaryotic-like serine/threonine-protein kinase
LFAHSGEVFGDYRVVEAIGSGGMGAVYKVEHLITGRTEAIKVLNCELGDGQDGARFLREIQVQARLQHPNIASVYNAFRAGSRFVMVMEYVRGAPLSRLLKQGPLPWSQARDYACQVLSALAYAHRAGVVHRDVSPANILLTGPEASGHPGTVKLTDFGLARTAKEMRVTQGGAPVGSPWYMSPEQVTGGAVDPRSDIYSVGAVLSEMLTGRKLFEYATAFEVMRAQVERAPVPPGARNGTVPPGVDAAVLKALAKDPAERFQSAEDFSRALQNAENVRDAAPLPVPVEEEAPEAPKPVPARAAVILEVLRRRVRPMLRRLVLAAVIPAALAAGVYGVRLVPGATQRIGTWGRKAWKSAKAHVPAAAVKAVAAPKAAAGAAPAPKEAPVAAPDPIETETAEAAVRPVPPKSTAAPGRVARRTRSNSVAEIRIIGGEPATPPPPVIGCPSPKAEHAAGIEAGAVVSQSGTAAAVEASPAVTVEKPPEASKPRKTGNRFLRALGKIVPFGKSKEDPEKSGSTRD